MPWTFRPENYFLAKPNSRRMQRSSLRAIRCRLRSPRFEHIVAAGIDGFFTDDPALGRLALGTKGFAGEPL